MKINCSDCLGARFRPWGSGEVGVEVGLSVGEMEFLFLCGPDVAAEQLLPHTGSSNSRMVSLGGGGASFGRQLVRTGWGSAGLKAEALCTGHKCMLGDQKRPQKDLRTGAAKRWDSCQPRAQMFQELQHIAGV